MLTLLWFSSTLYSMSMMWHASWMQGFPLSEAIATSAHGIAVLGGLIGGVWLFRKAAREHLNRLQISLYVFAFMLSIVSLVRIAA